MPLASQSETRSLTFTGLRPGGDQSVLLEPSELIIAGWAGRDSNAIEAHIRELEEIGVARPRNIPSFYRVASTLLTQAPQIEVAGDTSSGEAEVVLLHAEDGYWITLGSDHTDRKLEAVGVTLSKQVCAKPLGTGCWKLEDLRGHWDELILRATIANGDQREIYQDGSLASLHTPDTLLSLLDEAGSEFPVGSVMFCGTVPVHGGLRFAGKVELELLDPVLNRSLRHAYSVRVLEIVD